MVDHKKAFFNIFKNKDNVVVVFDFVALSILMIFVNLRSVHLLFYVGLFIGLQYFINIAILSGKIPSIHFNKSSCEWCKKHHPDINLVQVCIDGTNHHTLCDECVGKLK